MIPDSLCQMSEFGIADSVDALRLERPGRRNAREIYMGVEGFFWAPPAHPECSMAAMVLEPLPFPCQIRPVWVSAAAAQPWLREAAYRVRCEKQR